MKIKVPSKTWHTGEMKRHWNKLANLVSKHYPMDSALHGAVRGVFKSSDTGAMKLKKTSTKTSAKRKAPKRRTTKRGTQRRRATGRRAPKRSTARRRTTKRRTARAW